MNKWICIPVALAVALVVVVGAGCGGGSGIDVGGSTTVQPLAEKWAKAYEGGGVTVTGGGSSAGVKGVTGGVLDIGAISRDLKSDEMDRWPDLVATTIAHDGVAIVVHPSNPNSVTNLTIEEVRDIFAVGSTS